jgi:hypothetical protein
MIRSRLPFLRALPAPVLAAVPFAALLLLSSTSGGSCASGPAVDASPSSAAASVGGGTPAASAPAPSAALAAALDTIHSENIKADIEFIASDQMGGRDTPSRGLEIAARFLRARLERLGWKPGAGEGYFQTYELMRKYLDPKESRVVIHAAGGDQTLKLGQDYFIPARSQLSNVDVRGKVVFCGQGTDEDFAKAKVEKCWALCFDPGANANRDEQRKLVSRAKKNDAIGLIFAPGPDYDGDPYSARYSSDTAQLLEGRARYMSEREERPESIFPQLRLDRPALDKLLGGATPALGAPIAAELSEKRTVEGKGRVAVENVCGFWPGSDPVLTNEVVILSAHYDHVGTTDGVVYNGADDNGSGTCTMLAVAEALARYGPLRRSVMIVWVSGEEKGLWGSDAWSKNPTLPPGHKAIADINIDMVGRNAPDKLLVTPTSERKEYNGLVRLAESLSPLEGFPKLGSADTFYTRSDHINFAKLGIPIVFLFSDVHEDYHKPTDDPEKIDGDKVRRVSRLVVRMLEGLQGDELKL